ncbi:MAG: HAMP domain-containing sensor histidine kinase [Bacteroidota bacterium]
MKSLIQSYKGLQWIGLICLAILILMQVSWLYRAIQLQEEEADQSLKRHVGEMALAINAIGHDFFHGDSIIQGNIPWEEVQKVAQQYLQDVGIEQKVEFALYQKKEHGVILASSKENSSLLLASDIKSCISCILSFSTVKKTPQQEGESKEAYTKRLTENATFQYYSPVTDLVKLSDDTLWLSLYKPFSLSSTIQSLIWLFLANVLLLLIVLLLFQRIHDAYTRFKEISQVKDDFFNHMTHEFKTPLASIRLASRVLKQAHDPSKTASYHNLIEKESLMLEKQVDQLLTLSMIDEQGLQLVKGPVNLHELLQHVPSRLKVLIEEKEAQVNFDLNLHQQEFMADSVHLSNSLVNLVENALKYSQKGVSIWLSTFEKEGKRIISIKDNGPGIDKVYQDRIFERFFRGQKDNEYKGQGFGLGLNYAMRIIEGHQGQLSLNKDYHHGSEFIITFS